MKFYASQTTVHIQVTLSESESENLAVLLKSFGIQNYKYKIGVREFINEEGVKEHYLDGHFNQNEVRLVECFLEFNDFTKKQL